MQVLPQNSIDDFIKLAKSVEKEKALWRFIHIHGKDALEVNNRIVQIISTRHLDGDVTSIAKFSCGDIFILTKGKLNDLKMATQELKEAYHNKHIENIGIEFYDLSLHWGKFVNFVKEMKSKFDKPEPLKPQETEKQVLGIKLDADDLQRLKAKRNAREDILVLLVDDEPLTLNVIRQSIVGYRTIIASDAQKALEQYFSQAPDIVFLDIDMPTSSGHDVLRIIKKYDPDAHVIMLSGNSYREQIQTSIQLGAKGFVAKPFSRQKLLRYLTPKE